MKDLKQKLIDSEQVRFLPDEFGFKVKLSEKDAEILEDDEIPLQHYGIRDHCKLFVVRPYLFLTLMSEDQSSEEYRKIPMKTTVEELKMMIKELFCDKKVTDISMFLTNDQIEYVKLCSINGLPVGDVLSDDQTVCYLENKYEFDSCYVVEHWDIEIGRVYGVRDDTVQNQLSIPANCLTVTKSEWDLNDLLEECDNVISCLPTRGDEKIGDLEITISVDATWDNSHLPIVRPYLFLTLVSQDHSEKAYKKVLKKVPVKELENMVMKLFCEKKDISLFITCDKIKFVRIVSNKDVSVGEILSDDQTVCYLEDKCDYSVCFPVKPWKTEISKGYADKEDTEIMVKLRIQDQLDIPANCITITSRYDDYGLEDYSKKKITAHVDKSLPLHYRIQDDGKLLVDRPYIFLTLMNKEESRKCSERCKRKQLLKK